MPKVNNLALTSAIARVPSLIPACDTPAAPRARTTTAVSVVAAAVVF